MVLVKGGYVVDPASGFEGAADILMENGKILAIGPDIGPEEGMEGKKSGGWDSRLEKDMEVIHAESRNILSRKRLGNKRMSFKSKLSTRTGATVSFFIFPWCCPGYTD